MENTGIWVAVIIIIFVMGSIFGLRVSPREKALGIMRDKARKMGLHPRLVVAPKFQRPLKVVPVWLRTTAYSCQMRVYP